VDESDLGSIQTGQQVSFRVDAYPTRQFTGIVEQVRLNPVVSQNVVTYAAIISAPNPQLELKPGMTANLTIEVARRDDILRVPTAALRFRPTEALLASLGQSAGALKQTGSGGAASQSAKAGTGKVWVLDGGLRAANVTTGVTDGSFTEVSGDGVSEGQQVATRIADAGAAKPVSQAASPLIPQMGPPRR
jgi:HlyD family secretion protein